MEDVRQWLMGMAGNPKQNDIDPELLKEFMDKLSQGTKRTRSRLSNG